MSDKSQIWYTHAGHYKVAVYNENAYVCYLFDVPCKFVTSDGLVSEKFFTSEFSEYLDTSVPCDDTVSPVRYGRSRIVDKRNCIRISNMFYGSEVTKLNDLESIARQVLDD